MTRQYETVGPGGVGTLAPPNSDYINVYSMDGTNPATINWPVGMTFCNIAGTADYWVGAIGHTAVVPVGSITDGTGSAINVAQRRRYQNEASFSIISSTAQYITVEFWGG